MKRTLILGTALAALLLTGCQSLKEEHSQYLNREEKITNVVGQVWRIDAKWPGDFQSRELSEHLYESAMQFCGKNGMGMMPLRGSASDGKKDGTRPAEGWLEFRCDRALNYRPEYKGITGTFNPEDLTDFSNQK